MQCSSKDVDWTLWQFVASPVVLSRKSSSPPHQLETLAMHSLLLKNGHHHVGATSLGRAQDAPHHAIHELGLILGRLRDGAIHGPLHGQVRQVGVDLTSAVQSRSVDIQRV